MSFPPNTILDGLIGARTANGRDTDEHRVPAGRHGIERLQRRCLAADRVKGRIDAEPVGQRLDLA